MMSECRELCYAVDESGNYTTVRSTGWKAKQIVNAQAWELIEEKANDVKKKVLRGELSPIAYYMARHQMDLKLLSDYAGFSKRKIKKHLNPECFDKLDDSILEHYAKVFSLTVDELKEVR
ncbi:MAG TPA: hypothetical protein ENH40_03650 [Nitrospirae bacterium]|nr:hypothetical protein [Nitrospirota bacterium]